VADPFFDAVTAAIASTVAETRETVAATGHVGAELVDAVAGAAEGGKRMRARALMTSYVAHGGDDLPAAATVAAALELFQAAALVHDDLLDDASTRRGRPTAHIAFAKEHSDRGGVGSADRFGLAGAVLSGDLALVAAMRAIVRAPLGESQGPTLRLFTEMMELVTVGQYLDMRIAATPLSDLDGQLDAIRSTMRAKTASYTAEFPLALGASAAGADAAAVARARDAGLPAGIAFQLRDDLLGLVGDSSVTGKPVGEDIREGKRTVPLWLAWTRADAGARELLQRTVGNAHASEAEVAAAIAVIENSGAIAEVEAEIDELTRHSRELVGALKTTAEGGTAIAELLTQWGAREA
jgi:geranylgeranyl diphosphate synthase type I